MNRKKKINQTLKSKAKKANAKLQSSNKRKYIEALAVGAGIESQTVDATAVNAVTFDTASIES